jgi:MFS family permease
VPMPALKAALCGIYGFGVAPVFPLLMARGTREFPAQSGSVTGVLFGSLALGGMVFPLLLGAVSSLASIQSAYLLCAAAALGLLITAIAWRPKA